MWEISVWLLPTAKGHSGQTGCFCSLCFLIVRVKFEETIFVHGSDVSFRLVWKCLCPCPKCLCLWLCRHSGSLCHCSHPSLFFRDSRGEAFNDWPLKYEGTIEAAFCICVCCMTDWICVETVCQVIIRGMAAAQVQQQKRKAGIKNVCWCLNIFKTSQDI